MPIVVILHSTSLVPSILKSCDKIAQFAVWLVQLVGNKHLKLQEQERLKAIDGKFNRQRLTCQKLQ